MIEITLTLVAKILGCILVLRLVKYFIDNRNYYKNALKFPSAHPFLPSWIAGWIIVPLNKFDAYKLILHYQRFITNAEFASGWLLGFNVTTARVEHLQVMFQNRDLLNKSDHYRSLDAIIGKTGLIHAGGETFKPIRKVVVKCFVGSCQDIVTDSFYRAAKLLENNLKEKIHDGGWFKLSPIAHETTTSVICWSGFDVDVTESIRNCVHHLEKDMVTVITNGLLTLDLWAFKLSFFGARVKEIQARYATAANEIRTMKRNQLREIISRNEEPPNQFIYNLFRELGDDSAAINDQIITVLLTALETTGTTISLTLTMLAMHPEMQEKVYEEDRRIQEELKGTKMTEKDFNRYEYLNRVVKETLRLVPPAYLFGRKATADIVIDKYTLPKDGCLFVCVPFIHRNPEYYPDPMKFDPDRFLPENVAKRSKYAYIPFSLGQRQCPGMQFAHSTVLFMVSSVIRKFKIFSKYKTIEELDANLTGLIVLYDKEEFPTRLELR